MARPIVWLASFPKSGSTWLRFLLLHVFHGAPSRSADIDAFLPSLHGDHIPPQAAVSRGGVVLTHKARGPHLERWPAGVGVIHLVRHPIDVILSDTRYFVMTQLDGYVQSQGRGPTDIRESDIQELSRLFLSTVMQGRPTPQRRELGVDTWDNHTRSWRDHDGPRLELRYEDLRAEPIAELSRVLRFLGLPVVEPRIRQAIAACSVDAMRAMQEREIRDRVPGRFFDPAHVAGYRAGLRFVGPARIGDLQSLPLSVREHLHRQMGDLATVLGYNLLEASSPVLSRTPPEPNATLPAGMGALVAAPVTP